MTGSLLLFLSMMGSITGEAVKSLGGGKMPPCDYLGLKG
jgi:hypothetical protein